MILGLDFGGTKLAAGIVSASGRLVASRRCATPAGTAPASLQAMHGLARALIAEAGPIERIVQAQRSTFFCPVCQPRRGWPRGGRPRGGPGRGLRQSGTTRRRAPPAVAP